MDSYYDPATIATLKSVFRFLIPEVVLLVVACILFLGGTIGRGNRNVGGIIALVGLAAAAIAAIIGPGPAAATDLVSTVSPIWPDALAEFTRGLALGGGALLVLLSWDEVPDAVAGEFHACLLLIIAGTSLTGFANELITLFLALELVSIPTYIILYLPRPDRPAQEAAVKYFLLSIFSSALLLFGFSYLYGLTGTTNIPALLEAFSSAETASPPSTALAAAVMVVAGLGFRIAAVPFHFYAPDVYQGAPTSGAGLLAFIPKVAGFVALIRLLGYVGPIRELVAPLSYAGLTLKMQVPLLLWIMAAISMTLGNVVALWQDNLQRILAYSSVANAGYMLIGLTAAPYLAPNAPGGVGAVLFYLVAYGAMTLGAFGVIALLNAAERRVETVDDLAGLGRSHPGVALLMALFLFSLIGLPLTAGFTGKLQLFWGAVEVWQVAGEAGWLYLALAVVAAVNAAIGAYYYLRIISIMYLRGAVRPLPPTHSWPGLVMLWICALLTIWLGVYGGPMQRVIQTITSAELPEH